jgi:hypothetical protein
MRDEDTLIGSILLPVIEQHRINKQRREQKEDRKQAQRDRKQAQRDRRRMQRQQVNPARKSLCRALAGAGVLMASLWLSPFIFEIFRGLVSYVASNGLQDVPPAAWVPLGVWAFVTLSGLVALLVGLREASLSVVPNRLAAFWAAWGLVGLGWLLVEIVPANAAGAYWMRGLYATVAAILAVYFFIASGLAAANARRVMRRQLKQRNVPLQPARPRPARRWFFLWLW